MKTIQSTHTFSVDRETYVDRIFLDEGFQNALHKHLKFKSRELLEREEGGETLRLKMDFVSGEKLPFVARKLWGDNVGWVEDMVYFKSGHRSESEMTPTMLAKQVKIFAEVTLTEPSPGKTKSTTEIQINVKVPVVGGAIAKKMCKDMADNLEESYAYTETYLKKEGL